MKKLIVFTLVALCTSAGYAQGFKFSAGVELALATGNFSNTHSFGIGATAQAEVHLQDKLYGTAYGGFLTYNGKSAGAGIKYKGQSIIPIRVGVKYFLTEGIYGGLQAGLGFLNNGAGTAFSYSPQIGYEFKTKSDKSIDATFKYDAYSKNGTLGSFGFRLAYIF